MKSTKRWVYVDECGAEGWNIVEEGSAVHQCARNRELKYRLIRTGRDPNEGGIVVCSEWIWLDPDIAKQIVSEHNTTMEDL